MASLRFETSLDLVIFKICILISGIYVKLCGIDDYSLQQLTRGGSKHFYSATHLLRFTLHEWLHVVQCVRANASRLRRCLSCGTFK